MANSCCETHASLLGARGSSEVQSADSKMGMETMKDGRDASKSEGDIWAKGSGLHVLQRTFEPYVNRLTVGLVLIPPVIIFGPTTELDMCFR